MNTRMLKIARRLWANPDAPTHINRANARKWARAIRQLGENWLLAKPVERRA